MLRGNCTEALSIQANVTISDSRTKLIKNDTAPLPFPLPALLKQYCYIKRGERVRVRGHAPLYATLGFSHEMTWPCGDALRREKLRRTGASQDASVSGAPFGCRGSILNSGPPRPFRKAGRLHRAVECSQVTAVSARSNPSVARAIEYSAHLRRNASALAPRKSISLWASAATSPVGNTLPVPPSSIRSGAQPAASLTMAGTPHAIASFTTRPQDSQPGKTTTSDAE